MEIWTIVMMVIILGSVWGGFALLLRKAVRREAAKLQESSE